LEDSKAIGKEVQRGPIRETGVHYLLLKGRATGEETHDSPGKVQQGRVGISVGEKTEDDPVERVKERRDCSRGRLRNEGAGKGGKSGRVDLLVILAALVS